MFIKVYLSYTFATLSLYCVIIVLCFSPLFSHFHMCIFSVQESPCYQRAEDEEEVVVLVEEI